MGESADGKTHLSLSRCAVDAAVCIRAALICFTVKAPEPWTRPNKAWITKDKGRSSTVALTAVIKSNFSPVSLWI